MNFKLFIAAAAVAMAATSADALSIKVFDDATNTELGSAGTNADSSAFLGLNDVNGIDITVTTGTAQTFPPEDSMTSTLTVNNSTDDQTGIVRVEVTQAYSNPGFMTFGGSASNQVFGLNTGVTSHVFLTESSSTLFDVSGTKLLSAGFGNQTDTSTGSFNPSEYVVTMVYYIGVDSNGDFDGFVGQSGGTAEFSASPVPVPAGILLMGTAIAGFGVMRRRKQRA